MPRITIRVSEEQLAHIMHLAQRTRLSKSDLLRRVVLGYTVPDRSIAMATRDILRVNADLARLGNLLKGLVDARHVDPNMSGQVLRNIEQTQSIIRDKVARIS